MSDWTGALLLAVWALTVGMAALAAGMSAWGWGFVRGVRWERSKHQAWLGRERRKTSQPVPVDRRATRLPAEDLAQQPPAPREERRSGHRAPDTEPSPAVPVQDSPAQDAR